MFDIGCGVSLVQEHFIDVAPAPILAGLKRFHDRMLGLVKVFGGVFVPG
jgi:hypothetical protein